MPEIPEARNGSEAVGHLNLYDMMKEKWKDIKQYEGLYQISNLGKVKRLGFSYNSPFQGKVIIPYKILQGSLKDGYQQIALFKNGVRELVFIHRLVAIAFISNCEDKPFVNHKDSIRSNNKVDNLEWVTAKENSKHAHASGTFTMPRGENTASTNLKNEDVKYIKDNPDNLKQKEIALKFGISQGGVSKIQNNKNWKYHQ